MVGATIVFASTKAASSIQCHRRRHLFQPRPSIRTCRIREASRRKPIREETIGRKASFLGRENHHQCCMVLMAFLWLLPLHRTIIKVIRLRQLDTRHRIIRHRRTPRGRQLHMIIVVRDHHHLLRQTRMSVENAAHLTMILIMKVLILLSLRIRVHVPGFHMSHVIVLPMVMTIPIRPISPRPLPRPRRHRTNLATRTPALPPRQRADIRHSLRTRTTRLERFPFVTRGSLLRPGYLARHLDLLMGGAI